MNEQVVLVDENDNKIGLMDKLEAHRGKGTLHRAISVLLYRKKNERTEVLLQQRSKNKPLWPLYWSNTVCTHPRDGEIYIDCCTRRLKEEMGISIKSSELIFIFKLLYQAKYSDQYSEYELDSVFVGEWDGQPKLNPIEGNGWRWTDSEDLQKDIQEKRRSYTPWFKKLIADERTLAFLKK